MFCRSLAYVILGLSLLLAACSDRPRSGHSPALASVQAEWDRAGKLPTWNSLTLAPSKPYLGENVFHCGYDAQPPVTVDPAPADGVGTSFVLDHPRGEPRAATLVSPCRPRDLSCFVSAHEEDGVRVVDARQPARAQVSGALRLPRRARPGWVRALHGFTQGALVVRDVEHGYELIWISTNAQEGPQIRHLERAEGAFRGSYAYAEDGEASYVAIVADRYDTAACPRRLGTSLRVVKLESAGPSEVQELALGPDLRRVSREGPLLLLVEQPGEDGKSTLRLLDMTVPAKPRLAGEGFPLGDSLRARELMGRSLQLVTCPSSRLSQDQREMERTFSVQTIVLGKVAEDESFAPQRTTECTLTVQEHVARQGTNVGSLRGVVHDDTHTELFFAGREPGLLDSRRIRRANCEEVRSELAGDEPRRLRGGLLFDVGYTTPQESSVRVTDRRKSKHTTAEVRARLAPPSTRAEHGWRAHNAFWESSEAWFQPQERWLAALTFHEVDGEGVARLGSQLVEIHDAVPKLAAKLPSRIFQVSSEVQAVALDAAGLVFWDLTDAQAPKRVGDVPVWPRYLAAALMPTGVARLRHPSPSGQHDALTGSTFGRLEFVPSRDDAQLARANGGVDLSGNASLYVMGKYLVSVAQELGRFENKQERPCEIRVFELAKGNEFREVASLRDNEMCSAAHALGGVFPLQEALVFARAEHVSDDLHRTAFFVLSLKEPTSLRLAGPFRTPARELSGEVSSDGKFVYQFMRVPSLGGYVGKPGANHYLRRLDFSDPEHPRLGEAIALEGEPMLREGDAVYTREVRQTARGPRSIVRKLRVQGDTAQVERSRDFDGRDFLWLQSSDRKGHVLASWSGPGQRAELGISQRIYGLIDAATLEDAKGVARSEPGSRVGVQAGRALLLRDGVLRWGE